MLEDKAKLNSYFNYRNVSEELTSAYNMPVYLKKVLPTNKDARILDIGCGLGMFLTELKRNGYQNGHGIDISNEAIDFCVSKQLSVTKINNITSYIPEKGVKYDFLVMSHVLEHIQKDKIIDTLAYIKENLMAENASFIIMVPNAQTNTGAYWMYEDFTHTTLFTSGSLFYVLKSAGFNTIDFVDIRGLDKLSGLKKIVRNFLINIYIRNYKFWNRVTSAAIHKASPIILTFEIKALVKN